MTNILIISGFDPTGGGGTLADFQAVKTAGGVPFCVTTAITAQNSNSISLIKPLSPDEIVLQLDALFHEFNFDAVKIGMVGTSENAKTISGFLIDNKCKNIVLDPVVSSTSGGDLLAPASPSSLFSLLEIADLVTPNIPETQFFLNYELNSVDDMEKAGREMLKFKSRACLIKGGHFKGKPVGTPEGEPEVDLIDVLVDKNKTEHFKSKRLKNINIRGTGCWLSSMIATFLSADLPLTTAISEAKTVLYSKMQTSRPSPGGASIMF